MGPLVPEVHAVSVESSAALPDEDYKKRASPVAVTCPLTARGAREESKRVDARRKGDMLLKDKAKKARLSQWTREGTEQGDEL